jgi:hypothetical protein
VRHGPDAFDHHGHDQVALPAPLGEDHAVDPQLSHSAQHRLHVPWGRERSMVKASEAETNPSPAKQRLIKSIRSAGR